MKNRSINPFLLIFLAASPSLHAQINTWTGATSGNWNTSGNWSNNAVPNAPGTDVTFNASGLNPALNLSANTTIRSLFLFGGNYALAPTATETLTIQGGGFTQLGSGTFSISNDILGVSGNNLLFNGTGSGSITLSGTINNIAQNWDKFNTSDVTLTNAYTTTSVSTTALRVRAGNLILSGAGSITQGGAAQITIGAPATYQAGRYHNNANAALLLDNTGTNNITRVTDTNQINVSNRGLIEFRGNAAAASTETLGTLNSAGCAGTRIRVDSNGGQSAWLTFASITIGGGAITGDTNGNPTLFQYQVPTGDTLGAAGAAGGRVISTAAPTLTNGVLRYSIVKDESVSGGATFATYDATPDSGAALGVMALGSYTTTDIEASTSTANTDITGSATLSANRAANALRINTSGTGESLDLDSNTLTLQNATGFIFNGGNDYTISNTSGSGLIFTGAAYSYINSSTLTISAPVVKGSEFTKAGDGALVVEGDFSNNSGRQLAVDDGAVANDMSVNGAIFGGSALTKTGRGTLVLGGSGDNSSFFAGVNINAGTLALDKSDGTLQEGALGGGTIALQGGVLSVLNTAATFSNTLSLGTLGSSQSGNVIEGNAAVTFSGTVQGSQATDQTYPLINNSSAELTLSGNIVACSGTLSNNRNSTIDFSGSGTTKVSGNIENYSDSGFTGTTSVTQSGAGSLILSGTNTYTGTTSIVSGYLRADSASALGSGNLFIAQANYAADLNAVLELGTDNTAFTRATGTAAGQVNLGGTSGNSFNHAGFASVTGTSTVNLGGAGATAQWGLANFFQAGGALILGSPNVAGTVDFQNPIELRGNRTITALNGGAAVDGIVSGVIANGTGTRNLTKNGAGTLSLTAANTYTGTTTVSAGTLLANNTTGSATGSGAVTVNSGAALGGNGTISGATTVNGGLAPGNSFGTLTFTGGLTIGPVAASSLQYELGAPTTAGTTYDTIATNNLDIGAGTLGFSSFQFTGTPAVGVYTLFSSTNPISGSLGAASGSIGGFTGTLSISGGNNLILTVSSGSLSPYDTWAGSFPGFTPTTPDLDFDNDGLENLLEFVLGGNPTISQAGIAPSVVNASGTDLIVTFKRSDASELQPVAVKVQVSSDLSTWTPADDIVIGPSSNAGPIGGTGASYTVSNSAGMDTITVTIPKAAATKKFARVVAVQ